MARLELKEIITSPDSDTISGRATGEQYYKKCKVSEILDRNENIVIVIDDNIVKAINDSFWKGFFKPIIFRYKTLKEFNKHVIIEANDFYRKSIEKNIHILEAIYQSK